VSALPAAFAPETFRTSRLLDFASERELTAQIGHPAEYWPRVVVKELLDNSLDVVPAVGANRRQLAAVAAERGAG